MINYRAIKLDPYKHPDTRLYIWDLDEVEGLTYFVTMCNRDWHCACGDDKLYGRAKWHKDDKEFETDEKVELIDALNALNEGEFVERSINGSCQGDFGYLYIDKEHVDMTDYIEAVVFGTGTEIKVEILGEECPAYFYTEKWRDNELLEAAADYVGCPIDEIELVDEKDLISEDPERFTSEEFQEFEEAKASISTTDLVNLLDLLNEKGIEDDRVGFLKKVVSDLKTDKFCPCCGLPLYKSDLPQYHFVCTNCDENFFDEEV